LGHKPQLIGFSGGFMFDFFYDIKWWNNLIIGLYLCLPVGWFIGKWMANNTLKKLKKDEKK